MTHIGAHVTYWSWVVENWTSALPYLYEQWC
jgi:hypothetical protein